MVDEEPAKRAQIRTLNDRLRQTGSGGTIQITSGLAALGPGLVFKILAAVAAFNQFTPTTTPGANMTAPADCRRADHPLEGRLLRPDPVLPCPPIPPTRPSPSGS